MLLFQISLHFLIFVCIFCSSTGNDMQNKPCCLVITASFCLFSSRYTNWLHQQTKISFTTKTFVLIAFDWKREMLNVKLFFDRWFPNELSLSIQYLSITSGGRHVLNDYAKRNKKFSAGKKITMFVIILFIPLFEMWAEWKMFHILWHVFQFYDMWIVRSNKIILIGVFFSNWKFVHSKKFVSFWINDS